MTQSDVSASTGESETATSTPTRSSRAERNATATADLDRSGQPAAAGSAVQLAEIEEVDPGTVFQRDGAGFPTGCRPTWTGWPRSWASAACARSGATWASAPSPPTCPPRPTAGGGSRS